MKPRKGDIVKLQKEETTKLGLISQTIGAKLIRVGENWYDLDEFSCEILHSESDVVK
ncbi:hypothetical protein PBI_MIMI_113 [Arthrobacter phage Mimi]|nr:hypothetical protein PBI_MIMI_193 [Arthrobacter phage Mimi]